MLWKSKMAVKANPISEQEKQAENSIVKITMSEENSVRMEWALRVLMSQLSQQAPGW